MCPSGWRRAPPCSSFAPPGARAPVSPCCISAWASATLIPSTATAITTPARLERDSRAARGSIDADDAARSSARSGSPAATQAAAGSRRNSARNAGSIRRRSISSRVLGSSRSAEDTVHLRGAEARAAEEWQAQGERDRHEQQDEEPSESRHDEVVGSERGQAVVVAQREHDNEPGSDQRPHQSGDRVAPEQRRALTVL